MDLRHLKRIIKEFESSSIQKLEITEKDFTVKLEKSNPSNTSFVESRNNTEDVKVVTENKVPNEENAYTIVKSPLVGTYYDSPSPESAPFVTVNQRINKGDVLFIIEAMKVMNEIKSPVSGVVKNILAQSGNMVEYSQVIMEIEE